MKRLAMAVLLLAGFTSAQAADVAVMPPVATIDFCQRTPSLCSHYAPASADADQRSLIERINARVNGSIVPTPDVSITGVHRDHWDLVMPMRGGDCEDYALTKMFLLAWEGVPPGAMRIAIVHADWLSDDQDHAILLVRIDGVEYIADNRDARLRRASDVSYRWLKTSREGDLYMWVALFGAPQ
ncbi:MAG: transglutaminase-like cysteine peptidase [Rhizomicrobium sp.]